MLKCGKKLTDNFYRNFYFLHQIGYNGEAEKDKIGNDENKSADIASDRRNQSAAVVKGGACSRTYHEDVGIVNLGTDDEYEDNGVKNTDKLCGAPCQSLRKKYVDLKKSHFLLCHKHCELSMKFEELVATLNAIREAEPSNAEPSNAEVSGVPPSTDDVFTYNQLMLLKSLPLEQTKDSNFILQCIEYAYKDNTSALMGKTLFGTRERKEFGDDGAVVIRPAKEPLTPKKVKRIEELFVKRVTDSKCLSAEFAARIKTTNIHRLIASAIRNVCNKENPKKNLKNVNLNLS